MKVLYLLPGLLCDAATFAAQRQALGDTYDVRVPNFFGFDSIPAMAAAVLLDAPPEFAVMGFSMGGRVALEIMRMAPTRVTHLGLLATGAHPPRPQEAAPRQELIELANTHGMAALAARWLPPMLSPIADPMVVAIATAMVCRATPLIHARQIEALLHRPDATGLLPAITVPTCVICGELDRWATPDQHAQIAAAIPNATLVTIYGSGHFVPLEAADALTEEIRKWLA